MLYENECILCCIVYMIAMQSQHKMVEAKMVGRHFLMKPFFQFVLSELTWIYQRCFNILNLYRFFAVKMLFMEPK